MNAPSCLFQVTWAAALMAVLGAPAVAQTPTTTYQYEYDAEGRLRKSTDPLSQQRDYTYDALGRLKTEQLPAPVSGNVRPTITYTSDNQGRITAVQDPRNNSTTYSVNGYGENKVVSSPDSGTSNLLFDANGNLTRKTDARGKSATYAYDAMNRLTRITYTSGATISFSYGSTGNASGRLSGFSDDSGRTSYTYDAFGRVASKSQLQYTPGLGLKRVYTTAYARGTSGPSTGKISSITYPSGARVAYAYDVNGRVEKLSLNPVNSTGSGTNTAVTTTLLSDISYAPMGGVKGWSWGNSNAAQPNRVVREYDLDGRVVRYNLGNPLTTGAMRTVRYDAASRVVGTTHTGATNTSGLNHLYDYDNQDRLTGFISSSTAQKYAYDAVNNRLQSTVGASTFTNTIAPNSNRLTAATGPVRARSNQYDAAGNLTSDGTIAYTYNDAGRMDSMTVAGTTTTLSYNALGQRVFKSTAGSFVYDEDGHLLGEYDLAGRPICEIVYLGDQPVALLKWSVHGAGGGQSVGASASGQYVNTDVHYIYTDHLDTPRLITSASDVIQWRWDDVDPYGVLPPTVAGSPAGEAALVFNLRMPGQYYDKETNLHYNYFRDYDPQMGRYVQSDPIGLAGGLNTFSYVNGDPLSFIDPFGLDAEMCSRSLQLPLPYAQHCFIRYNGDNNDTQSYDPNGVHPDPQPKSATCTPTQGTQDDACLKREMQKCKGSDYSFTGHNCCHCVEDAMKACGQSIPSKKWPNWPINPGPQPGEPGYKP